MFLTICFFAPFSSFIRIDYPTFRHQAELDMLKMEPFTAKYAASSNHQRQDDVGIFLVSCILSAVSGRSFSYTGYTGWSACRQR